MDKYISIPAQQSNFSATSNLVDFDIPADGGYNLNDSYIEIMLQPNITQSAPSYPLAVHDLSLAWNDNQGNPGANRFMNEAIVKNCSFSNTKQGQIESLRAVDVLRQNLHSYGDSRFKQTGMNYLNGSNLLRPLYRQRYGIFADLQVEGNILSKQYTQVPVQIRLGDVMEFWNAKEYNAMKAGRSRLHLECNFSRLALLQNITSTHDFSEPTMATGVNKTYPAMGAFFDNVEITYKYIHGLDSSIWWVGQKVAVTATANNGAPAVDQGTVYITEISYDKEDGTVILTFNQSVISTVVTAGDYSAITVTPVDFVSATVSIVGCNLIMKKIGDFDMNMSADIPFNTYSVEQISYTGITNFQAQYMLEPTVSNVMIMFPDNSNTAGATGLISHNNNIQSWRLRLDNMDLTNRNVARQTPLYYDRLSMTLDNMGYSLNELVENCGDVDENETYTSVFSNANNRLILISNPIPIKNSMKTLQVNITSGGTGVKDLYLYKQMAKIVQM